MPPVLTSDETVQRLRAELAARFFRALGNPSRLRILDSLLEGERSVGELVEVVGTAQGRLSNHLACLKQCGFVTARREGKHVYYDIADKDVRLLLGISRSMMSRNAAQIWACTRVGSTYGEEGEADGTA